MDNLTPEQRKKNMQAVKSSGSKIEVALAKALFAKGFRYRKNDKSVFGNPDISFKKLKIAVFVDGEFWHGKNYEICKKKERGNREYWDKKIERNIERDREVNLQLQQQGWNVLRFWGKQVEKDLISCILAIEEAVKDAQMKLYEKISLEEVSGRLFKIKVIQEEQSNRESVLTHYLHSDKDDIPAVYKKEAVLFTQDVLRKKYPEKEKEITGAVAEEALSYGLFITPEIPFPPAEKTDFKFIDLFAGVGGFRLAMQNLGGKCTFSSEWNKEAQRTYQANFGEVPFGDITKESTKNYIPEGFDILCAGFPCQAFSIAGYRKGFSDTRGTLFFDIEQIIQKHRPKVIFLENVKNLVSHDKGRTFNIITDVLEKKLGYKVFHCVLNSMNHANVPQNRERIFIAAFDPKQVKQYKKFTFPEKIPLTKTIHDLLLKGRQDEKYYYKKDHLYYPELKKNMLSRDTVYQWRRIYVRENKNCVCPTLTANMGAGGHNVPLIKDDFGIRKLTPRECFSFQGYPENFVLPAAADSKLYMQSGNSVTMPLIERISREILKVL